MTYVYDAGKAWSRASAGRFRFDVLRLNVDARHGRWQLSGDYRLYPESSGGPMLKFGWLGYHTSSRSLWQVGVVPVPFGAGTSNSFYMNLDYYLGLEDDSDIGLRYTYQNAGWTLSAAYYKNDELPGNSPTSVARYAYDLGGTFREENQLNLFGQYAWGRELTHQLGLSAMVGGVYHIETRERGSRYAGAVHYTARYRAWQLCTQLSYYDIRAYSGGQRQDFLTVSAFGGSHDMASRAWVATATLRYRTPLRNSFVDELSLYNDLSSVHKALPGTHSSIQNILGCQLKTGPVITYLDCMLTSNHPYAGARDLTGLGLGAHPGRWTGLLMLNVGYYF